LSFSITVAIYQIDAKLLGVRRIPFRLQHLGYSSGELDSVMILNRRIGSVEQGVVKHRVSA
jgi:hypothetical protein